MSKIYQRQSKFDKAEYALREILHIDPENLQARLELSKIYQRQSKFDEAENILLEYLNYRGSSHRVAAELSKLYTDQGRLEKAQKVLVSRIKGKEVTERVKIIKNKYLSILNDQLMKSPEQNSKDFEELVRSLFEKLNVRLIVDNKQKSKDNAVDFSIWVDDISNSIGNPIVVETKAGKINKQIIKRTINQTRHYLRDTNARAALVIYNDLKTKLIDQKTFISPSIYVLGLKELIDQLREKSLDNVLVELKRKATL